jgi:cytochrome P450
MTSATRAVGRPIPSPDLAAAARAGQGFLGERSILGALEALHQVMGDAFRLPLPGFSSVVLVGPEANRFLLTESRGRFLWRAEGDPVTRLLHEGVLVTDGTFHDGLREVMEPALHHSLFERFVEVMWHTTDCVTRRWRDSAPVNLLEEMRRVALAILTETLFGDDFGHRVDALWGAIIRTIRYISPGPWVIWPGVPRPGYRQALQRMDGYLYDLIARRRAQTTAQSVDVLSLLIDAGMDDELIKDQLLTLFIAGHDTSTSLLSWALYLLARHDTAMARAKEEVEVMLGQAPPTLAQIRRLRYLDCVIKESLRLYPPIHLGSRIAATDVPFRDYLIPAGTRVLYSIYLTHRDKQYWTAPHLFDPNRFAPEHGARRPAYTFLPFGAGPRNCLGAAFAQVEAKVVLGRLLQRFAFRYVGGDVHPRMRATLEPSPGVLVEVQRLHSAPGNDAPRLVV